MRLADVTPTTAAFFRCAYAVPLLLLLARAERAEIGRTTRARVMAAVAGVLFAADLVFWHIAIDAVGAGLATVLGNLQVVMVGLFAWVLLGEKMERKLIVSVPLALVGVVLISGVFGQDSYGENPAVGVVFGVLTALSYSAFILILRRGSADLSKPVGPLSDATLAAAVTALAIGALQGDLELAPEWPAHGWLVTLAVTSQVVGWLLISISLPRLPAALSSVLLTIQPVGSVFLGMLLLDESPSALQLSGVVLILSGVMLAATRSRSDSERAVAEVPAP